MTFSVSWTDDAAASLTSLWLLSPDRSAITAAQAAIDVRLANNPQAAVRPLHEGLYVIQVSPLRALVEIVPEDHHVIVVGVRKLT